MPEQKFLRGHRVRISRQLPASMSHFRAGEEAIVDHSFSDIHGGDTSKQPAYCLRFIEDGTACAWYDEMQLTQVSWDREAGEQLLQGWKQRGQEEGG